MEEGQSKKTTPSAKNKQESGHLMLESWLKLLKCPVCWAIPELDTLIQCRNGHSGCRACFSRLRTCPICRIVLEPEIRTFDHDTIEQIEQELRHVESYIPQLSPELVIKLFECIRCKFVSTMAPVFRCLKGHVYCYKCPRSGRFCRVCFRQSNYTLSDFPFTIRSLAIQEILGNIPKPCRFANYGCSELIEDFTQHETNCQYSKILCVITLCPALPHFLCPNSYLTFYTIADMHQKLLKLLIPADLATGVQGQYQFLVFQQERALNIPNWPF